MLSSFSMTHSASFFKTDAHPQIDLASAYRHPSHAKPPLPHPSCNVSFETGQRDGHNPPSVVSLAARGQELDKNYAARMTIQCSQKSQDADRLFSVMSDGGQQQQRVLDLIDDPNALESFLGGLTSDSELLPSAESVDNVVASLARSLEAEYEVDSPNETLFDTLEASSNNLTDISQSYVPSDFENVTQGFSQAIGSLSNGESQRAAQHQQNIQNSLAAIVTSGVDQFLMSSTLTSSSNNNTNNSSNVTSATSNLHQFSSNCDSSPASQFIQQQQMENHGTSSEFSFGQDDLQKQTIVNQNQQIASLSSSSSSISISDMNQISSSNQNNSNNNNNEHGGTFQTQTNEMQQQQQGQLMQQHNPQQLLNNSNFNSIGLINNSNSTNNDLQTTTTTNVLTNNNNSIISNNSSSTIIQQQQQQFNSNNNNNVAQTGTISQLVSAAGHTVSLSNVGATQIIATSTGNIMTTGQTQANIIQQIQAGTGQSYITMDPNHHHPTTALIAGSTAFGATNLALVATGGGTPTYAVVPTGAQFLSNAIMAQPQTIQTLTKGPNGTYFQTTGGTQLVATSQMQNVNVSVANNQNSNNNNNNKAKQPQLLPKPQSSTSGNNNNTSTTASESGENSSSTNPPSVVVSSQSNNNSGTQSTSEGLVTQFFQQQQATSQIQNIANQVVVTSMSNQQPAFTISGASGLGQMVVSQNPGQQTQLTGTIVVNQYGQPMLVPSAGQPGLQFILRQQPQQQVLLQTPAGNTGGKPLVRYLSQVPQVAQSPGYGIQQIQTPNGPAWVAVRYPQTTIAATTAQITQMDTGTIQTTNVVTAQTNTPQQQQVVQSSQPQPPTTPTPSIPSQPNTPQPSTPQNNNNNNNRQQTNTPDSSSEPPPAKKSKTKPKSSKKKVTLDLEQLLKQSGIMDEDLQDDPFDFFGGQSQNGFESSTEFSPQVQESPVQIPEINTSAKAKSGGSSKKKSSNNSNNNSKKRKTPEKKRSPSPIPPPPPPPPPSKSKSKKKGSNTPKAENNKTDFSSSSKGDVPKKLSSLDDISATIEAVAAAARSPSPPTISSPPPSFSPAPAVQTATSNAIVSTSINKPVFTQVPVPISPNTNPMPQVPVVASNGINSIPTVPASITSNPPSGTTRIVQTIQLTPQNQQLLRNIQAQIARLISLPKRNDTEQTALQKLIHLQQQVISTGIPVPNPAHLNNLTQNATCNFSSTILPLSLTSSSASTKEILNLNQTTLTSSDDTNTAVDNAPSVTLLPANNINNNNNQAVKESAQASSNSTSLLDLSETESELLETMVKVVIDNTTTLDSELRTEENKENSASNNMMVASSSIATGTNTTNALGQNHVQSFPSQFIKVEKKTEEQKQVTLKVEEEKRARWKKEEFEMLLKRDQQCVTQPDYEVPFSSKRDAVERLLKYHILRDRNDMNFEEFDNEFGEKAGVLLDKFNGMLAKYRSLLLKESMKEVGCAERVMLERMFVTEEKVKLEQDRLLVNQGEVLELPPPPAEWMPQIQEMVEKEMKEMEQNSYMNMQVQSAIDSIIGFGDTNLIPDENENKIEIDAFGVPINNNGYNNNNNGMNASSADIDEAVRSILS